VADRYLRVDGAPYREWWQQQFATPPETLGECSFWQRGRFSIWVAAADVDPGTITPVDGVGIPFLRTGREVWKPTLVAVIEFGLDASRNIVELERDEMLRFLDRQVIEFAAGDPRGDLPNRGFVIARYQRLPLGCGLWSRGTLESAVPKGRRMTDVDLPIRR
jgi:NOL1/NOP2/fmu family ribosome biogenesis protein